MDIIYKSRFLRWAVFLTFALFLCNRVFGFDMGDFRFEIISEEDKTVELTEYLQNNGEVVVIPDKVTFEAEEYSVVALEHLAFARTPVDTIVLPATLREITNISPLTGIFEQDTYIKVAPGNPYYSSEEGILYSNNKTELVSWTFAKGNVIIPENIKILGPSSIYYHNAITSITLPSSLTEIKLGAFWGGDKLKTIYCLSPIPPIKEGLNFVDGTWLQPLDIEIYVPADSYHLYMEDSSWRRYNIKTLSSIVEDLPVETYDRPDGNLEIETYGNFIRIKGQNDGSNVDIYTISGLKSLSLTNYHGEPIDITNLSSGIYLVISGNSYSKFLRK